MKKDLYEKAREKKQYEILWFDLLNASGFAGVLPTGEIVDRRYYPEAHPVQRNSLFGVADPKEPEKTIPEDELLELHQSELKTLLDLQQTMYDREINTAIIQEIENMIFKKEKLIKKAIEL